MRGENEPLEFGARPPSDTDFQKKHGMGYAVQAAAAAGAPVPPYESRFDTEQTRRNQEEAIRVLTEENSRLLQENARLRKLIAPK